MLVLTMLDLIFQGNQRIGRSQTRKKLLTNLASSRLEDAHTTVGGAQVDAHHDRFRGRQEVVRDHGGEEEGRACDTQVLIHG